MELTNINNKTYKRDVISFCYDYDVYEFDWTRFNKGRLLVIFDNKKAAISFIQDSYYLVFHYSYFRS